MRSVTASVDIARPADWCWALLADVARVPEWVPGVADAQVIEAGPDGRPLHVRFVSMPAAGSLDYELRYQYDDGARTLRWKTIVGDDRSVEGQARIHDLGAGRCRLEYLLSTWAARTLPAWAQATLADDTPDRAARAFQRWAER